MILIMLKKKAQWREEDKKVQEKYYNIISNHAQNEFQWISVNPSKLKGFGMETELENKQMLKQPLNEKQIETENQYVEK